MLYTVVMLNKNSKESSKMKHSTFRFTLAVISCIIGQLLQNWFLVALSGIIIIGDIAFQLARIADNQEHKEK